MKLWKNIIWPLVPVVSFGGFFFPKLGLILFPMFLIIMISGFIRGRFWCGNLCPRGAFLDIAARKISPNKKISSIFRSKIIRFSALTAMFSVFGLNIFKAFSVYGSADFADKLGMAGVMMCAATTVIALILSVFIHSRTWCSFCPMGSVQRHLHQLKTFISKRKKFDKHVSIVLHQNCTNCKICSRVCPAGIDVAGLVQDGKNSIEHKECIKCGKCADVCRKNIIKHAA
ncbi:MAG: 4Fe-4S binding protein [Spirochaetes bacterium]|nr:4Fe-4S binding protein [Spirochaetota bacterium]